MSGIRFTPIIELPWFLRWTFGVFVVVVVVIPVAVIGALGVAVAGGFKAFWQCEAWRMISACFFAIVFGDEEKR